MYRVSLHRGPQGFEAVLPAWAGLCGQLTRPRYFHFPDWWRSCVRTLLPQPEALCLAVVRAGDRPVAVLPLERRTVQRFGFPIREIGLPFHPHLPLGDIAAAPDIDASALQAALRRGLDEDGPWDVLRFRGVLADSAAARLFADGVLLTRVVSHTCDYVDCGRPYEEITASFSRNFRSNLNKARNKLARETDVEFIAVTDREKLMQALDEFLEVEASGWKGSAGEGTAIKLHPELTAFYRNLIEELAPRGAAVINLLRIGGRAVAAQFCALDADTLYVLKLAYDEQWARAAPGNMLLEWVIKRAGAERRFRYLNLVNDPPWFKDWRPETIDVCNIDLYNRTPRGLALWLAMRAKHGVRGVRQRSPVKSRAHTGDEAA